MKKLFGIVAMALVAIFAMNISACKEPEKVTPDDDEEFSVTPISISFPADGDTRTVTVKGAGAGAGAGAGWTAIPSDEWIKVTRGKDSFTVTVGPTERAQIGYVEVTGEFSQKQRVSVTQNAPPVDPKTVTVDPAFLSFAAASTAGKSVTVTSETEWSVTANDSWITVTKNGSTGFTVSVGTNTQFDAPQRGGTITVDNGIDTVTVWVDQDGNPPVRIESEQGILQFYGDTGVPAFGGGFVWKLFIYTSGLTPAGSGFTGDGRVAQIQLTSTPIDGDPVMPDGDYEIEDSLAIGKVLWGYMGQSQSYSGTWIFDMEGGQIANAVPITSGLLTSSYSGGEYTVEIVGKDNVGRDVVVDFEGQVELEDMRP